MSTSGELSGGGALPPDSLKVASSNMIIIKHEHEHLSNPAEDDPSQNVVYTTIDEAGTHFLQPSAGEELAVELDGKLYTISTIQDEETGQLLNVINLTSEAIVENGSSLDGLEMEVFVPPADILVNGVDVEIDLDPEAPGVRPAEEYENDVAHLEEADNQVQKYKNRKMVDGDKQRGNKVLKKQKSRPGNKDATELPFTYAGQTFTVQAQKLILNVFDFFNRNRGDPLALEKCGTPQEQAGKVLNVSPYVIGKVKNRLKKLGKIVVPVPGQSRHKCKSILDTVDAQKEKVIRAIIKEFTTKQIPPTVSKVMAEVVRRVGFAGSCSSFRRVLSRMGFKSAKIFNRMAIIDANPPKTSFSFLNSGPTCL